MEPLERLEPISKQILKDILEMNIKNLKGISMDFEGEYPTAMGPLLIIKSTLGDNTFVGPNAIIQSGCELKKFCEVQNSIVFDNATIGEHTKLNRCIVGKGVIVPSNEVYKNKLFYRKNDSAETQIFDMD